MKLRFLVLAIVIPIISYAVNKDSLVLLPGYSTSVYYSEGHKARAVDIAARCDKAISYMGYLLSFEPQVKLLILSKAQWNEYTTFAVYGMPHYNDSATLIVAAEDNEFWQSFIPPIDQLPAALTTQVIQAYKAPDGQLSMMAFFDLLALHELGHAFHQQGGLTMQRKWMGELFSNIFLHTYIAENEPGQLTALQVFPEMVVSGGAGDFKYTTLAQFENDYDAIGSQAPRNYGWYQCRLHVAAKNIYNAGGTEVLKKLWAALKKHPEKMSDEAFAKMLMKEVHPAVANVYLKWDK